MHQDIRRTVVPISDISPYVRDATIAIEDAEFYTHAGIRPLSILRAVFINILKGGFSQGGSTITQQVVKNALLTQEKTIARKLKEWVLSIKLERAMTKDEILALYLNEAPMEALCMAPKRQAARFLENGRWNSPFRNPRILRRFPRRRHIIPLRKPAR